MTTLDQALVRILGIDLGRSIPMVIAFVVASLFFHFGSFALECFAFLALWRVLDLGARRGR